MTAPKPPPVLASKRTVVHSPRHNPPFWFTDHTCVVALAKDTIRIDLDACYIMRNGYEDMVDTWGSNIIDTQEARKLIRNLIEAIRDAETYDPKSTPVAPVALGAAPRPGATPAPAPLLKR